VEDEIRVTIASDVDMVPARQKGRELAARLGFSRTDATLIATAVSEIARNIIVHVGRGEIVFSPICERGREGIVVIARDSGPGIPDVAAAMQDGQGAEGGLGLGLPGSRRLMDDFHIDSKVGAGTTVTMKKWKPPKILPARAHERP
jgi:serine/threonine-protein kinase RsbT